MRCICCECGILYNVKPPFEQDDESHGYCEICFEWHMHNLKIRNRRIANGRRKKVSLVLGQMPMGR